MKKIAIDTNYLIDIVIDRDTSKSAIAKLKKVMTEFDTIFVAFHVMVEFIYVLENIHRKERSAQLSKDSIIDKVTAICSTSQFEIENLSILLSALELYRTNKIGDVIIASTLLDKGISDILSNDKHFKNVNGINAY